MRYVIYLRVSTVGQAEAGHGLHAQEDACRAYVAKVGGEIAGVYSDEGLSGASGIDKRPGLMSALASLSRGDTLLVQKRDRLGRDPLVIAMIEASCKRSKSRIVSTANEGTEGDSPMDIFYRRICDASGELERHKISERTKAALQAKKARGERVGHIPFGSKLAADGIHLEANEYEQEILAQIRALRDAGLSSRKIAAELNRRSITNRGRTWTHAATINVAA